MAAIAQPNDGTCNAVEVIERWKAKGWLDSGKHLDTHPPVGLMATAGVKETMLRPLLMLSIMATGRWLRH